MKLFIALIACFTFSSLSAQNTSSSMSTPDPKKKTLIVDASCGECQFHMTGKGCHLAVRIKDKTYFVEGTSIDDHGDAHAADGFCEAVKKAEVQGEIVDGKFKATYFKIIPPKKGGASSGG